MTAQPLTVAQTVGEIVRLANEYQSDVAGVPWYSVQDVFRTVRGLPYVPDEEAPENELGAMEFLKRPGLTLRSGGDCDDKTALALAGLVKLGVPARVVTVSYNPDRVLEHVYLEVMLPGSVVWQPFDPTNTDRPFTEKPFTSKIVWG
jgi:transglutaminase-like putative cysteine protease